MNTLQICIFVIGLVGTSCSIEPQAYPVGVCHPVDENTIYCTAEQDDFPGRLQPYIPEDGGINCVEPCDMLGSDLPVSENYNYALACPIGMLETHVQFELTGNHVWQCLDHGGEIKLRFGRLYNGNGFDYYWYIPFDVLWRLNDPYPAWMWMLTDWNGEVNRND